MRGIGVVFFVLLLFFRGSGTHCRISFLPLSCFALHKSVALIILLVLLLMLLSSGLSLLLQIVTVVVVRAAVTWLLVVETETEDGAVGSSARGRRRAIR